MKTRIPLLACAASLASGAALAAMIDVPQNRQEFVKAVSDGRGATAVETIASDRTLDEVYAILEDRSGACLDVTVKRTAYVGYVEHSSSDYNPTLRRVGKDRAELTLQVEHNPRGVGHVPPAGGLYIMAADLHAVDGNHTEIVLYRPTIGFKPILASLRQWLAGESTGCPKIK